jgi:hypothetical protein
LESHESEWFELAQELKVDAVALEVLVSIVQEGKWQQSTAPLMFVRKNVERRGEEWEDPFGEDGRLKRAQIFSPVPTREDRAWLKQRASIREWNATVTTKDMPAACPLLLEGDFNASEFVTSQEGTTCSCLYERARGISARHAAGSILGNRDS